VTREEALKKAQEYVASLATNSRGYQDSVTFMDKVRATERFARFLLGEADDE
jgi:hypothetical protein